MQWLAKLADRLVLEPSTHPIHSDLDHQTLRVGDDSIDLFVTSVKPADAVDQVLLIKFPGTGGRAERAGFRPAQFWKQTDTLVWAINPFGYGSSTGKATLQRYPEMVQAVGQAAQERHPHRTIIVSGVSLGSLSALALAANFSVGGVLLRNPVPLHQMISRRPRYAWPSLGLSRFLAREIPGELNAIENAKRATGACFTVSAGMDRVVPLSFQQMIVEHFAGPTKTLICPNATHRCSVPKELSDQYVQGVKWLSQNASTF